MQPKNTMKNKQRSLDKLCNTIRIYNEERIKSKSLFFVDKEEAINNLDRAFDAKLEAFHSLYDVTKTEIKYFDYADTSLIILIRNAIHQEDAY